MSVFAQREAAEIRAEWLGHLLSTAPADRPAAEAAISELYRLIGLDPPRFHWVASPIAALETVPPGLRLRTAEPADRLAEWPLPLRFRRLISELTTQLDVSVVRDHRALDRMMGQLVRAPIMASGQSTLAVALRSVRNGFARRGSWYEALCASWVAHYDAIRASGAVFTPEQNRLLDLWAAAVRSCGWWWPREDVCVVSQRPVEIHTEVWGDEGQVRLHRPDGPALRFADGWDVHAWHGTKVPSWVIDDADIERIARETNIEVRRCAIEKIGWGDYIDRAGLRLVAAAPDPGNPGSELRLYDLREQTRVLLAVNGSIERDGHRRRYGLTVPGGIDDPVAAAGWTYGLSGDQYSRLVRRT